MKNKMKLLLVAINNTGFLNEHVGIASIASFLDENDIESDLIQIDLKPEAKVEEAKERIPLNYDLYGFYIVYTNADLVTEVIMKLKEEKPNCLIFVGGHCATAASTQILEDCPGIDFVVLGDGQYPVLHVIKALESGGELSELESILTRNDERKKIPASVPLKNVPWPKRYYFDHKEKTGYTNARIVTSRKCMGSCSFCSTIHAYQDSYHHKRWEGRDIEDVFNEIIQIYETYGIRYFSFIDPSFEDPGTFGKRRVKQFCELIINYPVKFFFWCYLRAETFAQQDSDLIRLMKMAGFSKVFIGIESFNQEDLDLYDKKATVEDNYRAIRLFQDHGIEVVPGFIMINPLTTREGIRNNYHHLVQNKVHLLYVYITIIELFHNTPLYDKLNQLDLILESHSYKNPFGYKIIDPYVSEVASFINETFLNSSLLERESQYLYTANFMFTGLKTFFPEEYKRFEEKIEIRKDRLFQTMTTYLNILFHEQDLEKAKSEFPKFRDEMFQCYESLTKIQFQMLKVPQFQTYLYGDAMQKMS